MSGIIALVDVESKNGQARVAVVAGDGSPGPQDALEQCRRIAVVVRAFEN